MPYRRLLIAVPLLPMACCVALGNAAALWLDDVGMTLFVSGMVVCAMACLALRQGWALVHVVSTMAAMWVSVSAQSSHLPEGLTRVPLRVEGEIVQRMPQADQRVTYLVRVSACTPLIPGMPACDRLHTIRIGASERVSMQLGERWAFTARLKPPHGMANPGRIDTVHNLYRQGLDGVGERADAEAQRLAPSPWRIRYALLDRIEQAPISETGKRWLKGLLLGEQSAFTDQDWQLLNDTGTTHLVVVSGMHVGLVAGALYIVARTGARCLFPGRYRLMIGPRVLAVSGGIGYAVLANGSAPALRACIMMLPLLLSLNGKVALSVWQGWWCALIVVLITHPYALMTPGVALSFGAVATLILMWRGHAPMSRAKAFIRTQLWITLMLDGLLLCMFGRFAPLSFPANFIAIPAVTSLLMPLGIVGALINSVTDTHTLWQLFDHVLLMLLAVLGRASEQAPSWVLPSEQARAIGAGMMMTALINIVPGFTRRFRVWASLMLLPLLKGWAPPPDAGMSDRELRVDVLDVGQGQMVDIRTQHHRILYDTGPQNRVGRRAIEQIWAARQSFDDVIVSHGDLDHSGGVPTLMAQHHVMRWHTPQGLGEMAAVPLPVNESVCHAGVSWRYDGVTFRFLWPRSDTPLPRKENDRSCVLLIESPHGRILLTGDAGQTVEHQLLRAFDQPVDVWVAGHHGSHGSNTRALAIRARPCAVIYSAGFANAYRHPADSVVRRFDDLNRHQWNTASDGAVTVTLRTSGMRIEAQRTGSGVGQACL